MTILSMPISQAKMADYKCPCCGNENSKLIDNKNPHNMSLDLCLYCGFIYRAKWLDQASWGHFMRNYHKSPPNATYLMKENLKKTHIKMNMSEYTKGNPRTLDVGCGLGMAAQTISDNLIGLELADKHYKYAKYCTKIDVRNTYDIEERSFDLVILWGCLNYIPNVGKFLQNIKTRLNDDGHVLVHVPLIDQPNQDTINTRYALEYVNFFTRDTFKNLMATSGYEMVSENYDLKEPMFVFKPGKVQELKRYIGRKFFFDS